MHSLLLIGFIAFASAADPISLDTNTFGGAYKVPQRTKVTSVENRNVFLGNETVGSVIVYGDFKTVIPLDYVVKEAFASTDFPKAVPRLSGSCVAAATAVKDSIRQIGGELASTADSVRFIGGGKVTAKNSTIAFVLDTAKDAALITEAKAIQSSLANGGADARTSALVAKVFASTSSSVESITLTKSVLEFQGDLFSRAFLYLLSGKYETINADSTIKFTGSQLAPATTFNATLTGVKSITLTPSGDSNTKLTVQVGDTSLSTKNIDLISVINIDFPTGTFKFDGPSAEFFNCYTSHVPTPTEISLIALAIIFGVSLLCVICNRCLGKGLVSNRRIKPKTTEEAGPAKASDMELYADRF